MNNKLEMKVINQLLTNEQVVIVSTYIADLGYEYLSHDHIGNDTLIVFVNTNPQLTH